MPKYKPSFTSSPPAKAAAVATEDRDVAIAEIPLEATDPEAAFDALIDEFVEGCSLQEAMAFQNIPVKNNDGSDHDVTAEDLDAAIRELGEATKSRAYDVVRFTSQHPEYAPFIFSKIRAALDKYPMKMPAKIFIPEENRSLNNVKRVENIMNEVLKLRTTEVPSNS